jgi:hypothetical protein
MLASECARAKNLDGNELKACDADVTTDDGITMIATQQNSSNRGIIRSGRG